MKKQELVKRFAQRINKDLQRLFYEEVERWDGNPDFYNAYYDIDVLEMLLEQAKERL